MVKKKQLLKLIIEFLTSIVKRIYTVGFFIILLVIIGFGIRLFEGNTITDGEINRFGIIILLVFFIFLLNIKLNKKK